MDDLKKVEQKILALRQNKKWMSIWDWQYKSSIGLFYQYPSSFLLHDESDFRKVYCLERTTKEIITVDNYSFCILNYNLDGYIEEDLMYDLSSSSIFVANEEIPYLGVFVIGIDLIETGVEVRIVEYKYNGERLYYSVKESKYPSNERLVAIVKEIIV